MSNAAALIAKAKLLIDQNRPADADRLLQEYIACEPRDAYAFYLLALVRWQTDSPEALKTIDQALALEPEDADYMTLRAKILIDEGEHDDALKMIDRAVGADPRNPNAWAGKAIVHINRQEWQKAEIAARDCLELDPENELGHNMLMSALRSQGRFDECKDQILTVLAKNPESAFSHANAGWSYLYQNDLRNARLHFSESLRRNPNLAYAREGMLEVFKSASPTYRKYLELSLFLARQDKTIRVLVIVLTIFAARTVKYAARSVAGHSLVFAWALAMAWFFILFWGPIFSGLGNLMIFLDPWARLALSEDERNVAILTGAGYLAGVAATFAGIFYWPLFIIGASFLAGSVLFFFTFANKDIFGRKVYGSMGAFITASGALAFIVTTVSHLAAFGILAVAFLLFLASTWMWMFGVFKKE